MAHSTSCVLRLSELSVCHSIRPCPVWSLTLRRTGAASKASDVRLVVKEPPTLPTSSVAAASTAQCTDTASVLLRRQDLCRYWCWSWARRAISQRLCLVRRTRCLRRLTQKASDESVDRITKYVRAAQPSLPVPELRGYECNVANDSDVKSTWEKIVSDFGKIDVLLTAAGIAESMNAEVYDYARSRRIMDVNLDGSFLFAREAGRHMLEHKIRGSIILIASICGHVSVRPQKQAAYNVSKGGVILLAKSLATEWGANGIRVNSISPGYMNTEMVKSAREREGQEIIESWEAVNPMGRIGQPHELQGAAV